MIFVVRFVEEAKAALEEIYRNGQIPIIAGGTGFYIQALLYDINFDGQDCDADYRRELEQIAEEKGAEYLHQMLEEVDAESAKAIHANNTKRVIRALEFYHVSGKKISEHNETEHQKESPYNFAYFVLTDERERLYKRIEARGDAMMEEGLLDEVRLLKERGATKEMVSMQGLGYKEILAYLDGEISLERAVYLIKRDTRHFAKRQLTWFRRERDVIWFDKEQYAYQADAILADMLTILKEKAIL